MIQGRAVDTLYTEQGANSYSQIYVSDGIMYC